MRRLRRLGDRPLFLISLTSLCVLVATGCEPANTTSQVEMQTAEGDAPELAASVDEAPLLLEDEPLLLEDEPLLLEDEPLLLLDDGPVAETADDGVADNSRCFVCHINYADEPISVTHARQGMGCARCHGASDAHIADESWASGGNGTAPDIMYPRDKINPACLECHGDAMIDAPHHEQVYMTGDDMKVCTDCHGDHRLPQRRCKWK